MFYHRLRELGCLSTGFQLSSVEGCCQGESTPWHLLRAGWPKTAPRHGDPRAGSWVHRNGEGKGIG